MTLRNVLLAVLVVLGFSFAARTFVGCHGTRHSPRLDLADELAAFLVRELPDSDRGEVLVIAPPNDPTDHFTRRLASRLRKGLKGAGFARVLVETIAWDPMMEFTGEPISREKFLHLLGRYPEADTAISLIGVPQLEHGDLPERSLPRLVVAANVIMPYLETYPPGILDFAVVVRQNPSRDLNDPDLGALAPYFSLLRFDP